MITRPTLLKMERGDPSVSMGAYATALFVLGMVDSLAALADVGQDMVGQSLADEALPERIRTIKRATGGEDL